MFCLFFSLCTCQFGQVTPNSSHQYCYFRMTKQTTITWFSSQKFSGRCCQCNTWRYSNSLSTCAYFQRSRTLQWESSLTSRWKSCCQSWQLRRWCRWHRRGSSQKVTSSFFPHTLVGTVTLSEDSLKNLVQPKRDQQNGSQCVSDSKSVSQIVTSPLLLPGSSQNRQQSHSCTIVFLLAYTYHWSRGGWGKQSLLHWWSHSRQINGKDKPRHPSTAQHRHYSLNRETRSWVWRYPAKCYQHSIHQHWPGRKKNKIQIKPASLRHCCVVPRLEHHFAHRQCTLKTLQLAQVRVVLNHKLSNPIKFSGVSWSKWKTCALWENGERKTCAFAQYFP